MAVSTLRGAWVRLGPAFAPQSFRQYSLIVTLVASMSMSSFILISPRISRRWSFFERLADATYLAGRHGLSWSASERVRRAPVGLLFVRCDTSAATWVRKLVLIP